ncbi:putative transporter [Cladophialophora carrionii]|uniref:Putative transporter n=1 Tax=Cladophialophora carrionii TaxID=86049 RepID=A0A1C1CSS6_9EURO|nr:putative transporter [Cladophialophora carrionii]
MAEKFSLDVTRVEGLESPPSPARTSELLLEQFESHEKPALSTKLRWKRDIYVLAPLTVLYVFCFLDRTNIGAAVVFGLVEDLKLTGTQYNSALVCFFVPYVLFDIPSNILLLRFKPQIWLPACTLVFGVMTVLQGVVHNLAGIAVVRVFLGIAEAGVYPGCVYTISRFYRPEEAQSRFAIFVGSTTLAGAFGGLLASAIGNMDAICNLKAWRWIFILEGCLTVVVALVLFFLVTDIPEKARWLSDSERRVLQSHLGVEESSSSAGGKASAIGMSDVIDAFKDVKMWLSGFMYLGMTMPVMTEVIKSNGLGLFIPSIVRGLGYSPISTQLHTVPVYVAAAGFAFIVGVASDKTKIRTPWALMSIISGIVGFSFLQSNLQESHTRYAFLFLAGMGVFSAVVGVRKLAFAP